MNDAVASADLATVDAANAKITQKDRIARIFKKLSKDHFSVYLRAINNPNVAVRGKIAKVMVSDYDQNVLSAIEVDSITERGIAFLRNNRLIQGEFVMLSSKVVFSSRIIGLDGSQVLMAAPEQLTSIERRRNARSKTSPDAMAYVQFSCWQPREQNLYAAALVLPQYEDMANMLTVVDVSAGGLCAESAFPGPYEALSAGQQDVKAKLILPMKPVLEAPMVIRWCKKTREHQDGEEKTAVTRYRFGCEFLAAEKLEVEVRAFTQRIQQLQSI